MRKSAMIITSVILLVLLTATVSALGIRPAKAQIDFEPLLEKRMSLIIVNTEKQAMAVSLEAQGALKDYIFFEKNSLTFTPDEQFKETYYTIKMPSELPPGDNTGEIYITQSLQGEQYGENVLSANLRLLYKLTVTTPAPKEGVFAQIRFEETSTGIGIVTQVDNYGLTGINEAKSTISIFDGEAKLKELETNKASIGAQSQGELRTAIGKEELAIGEYRVLSSVNYDNQILEVVKRLLVGVPKLKLKPKELLLSSNDINEFETEVTNEWNKQIENAFLTLVLRADGKEVGSMKSPTFTVPGSNKQIIKAFLDATNLGPGTYEAILTAHYSDTSSQETFKLKLSEDAKKESQSLKLVYILLGTLMFVILVMFIILIVLLLRKRE